MRDIAIRQSARILSRFLILASSSPGIGVVFGGALLAGEGFGCMSAISVVVMGSLLAKFSVGYGGLSALSLGVLCVIWMVR